MQLVPLVVVEPVVSGDLLDVQGFFYPELDRSAGPVQHAWRRELKNTGMHATRGTQGNLPLQSISGFSNIK